MSCYVQTLSARDQAVLNNRFYRPSFCQFTKVEESEPIDALWTNSGYTKYTFPGPDQRLPRIRSGDVRAFREIWIRGPTNSLRGRFAPSEWSRYEYGYVVEILLYRTFKLFVCSKTLPHDIEFSTVDIDQVLTSCLEGFQGDEMPVCSGWWTRGAESVQWLLEPISRSHLIGLIHSSRKAIEAFSQKELTKQFDILIALRRFYKPDHSTDPDNPLHPAMLQENLEFNMRLDGILYRLPGVSVGIVRSIYANEILGAEYAHKSVQELVDAYMASRRCFEAMDCQHYHLK